MRTPEDRGVELIQKLLNGSTFRLTFELLRDDANDALIYFCEADFSLINQKEAAAGLNDEFGWL